MPLCEFWGNGKRQPNPVEKRLWDWYYLF
jgi:hypothetical protein